MCHNTTSFILLPDAGKGRPLSDGEHKVFRGWGTQGQLSLRDMSLSDDKNLERGTQGILSLRVMFLSDDKILKRVPNCGPTVGDMFLTETSLYFSTVSSGMNALNTGIIQCNYITLNYSLKIIYFNPFG